MKNVKIGIMMICLLVAIYTVNKLVGTYLNVNEITSFLRRYSNHAEILFLLFWLIRLPVCFPGVLLMVLGGFVFDPTKAFVLSMLGILLSESMLFIAAKKLPFGFISRYLNRANPEIKELVEQYKVKFLILGVICPIAPSDAVCYLSAAAGIRYGSYLITLFLANLPLVIIYSFMSESLNHSAITVALYVITFVLIMFISTQIWNQFKSVQNTAE